MKDKKSLIILCSILVVLVGVIVALLAVDKNKGTFKKPDFDSGVVEIPDNLEYEDKVLSVVSGYSVYISHEPKIVDDNYLKIDLVAPPTNNIYIKVRLLDKDKNIVGETGLLKAGEYLEKVKLDKNVKAKDNITYKIMGYEKNSYMSAGSVALNTRIGE